MNRPWILLPLSLLAGLLAFGGAYWVTGRAHRATAVEGDTGETTWLRREFRLNETEYARVAKLHNEYKPTCADLCRRISEQNEKLRRVALATNAVTPELRELLAETGRVRDECRAAMLAHLYAVAREMPAAEGQRYLEAMLSSTCVLQPSRSLESAHASAHDHGHHE